LGLTEQTSNFEPKHKITRAEFAHYLSIFFKLKVPTDNANLPKLKDINENTPYYAEINAVLAAGILQGTKQATFLPNKKINKAEAVVALVRYFNLKSDEQEIEQLPYKNIPKQHWIYVPLALAYQQGLISKARSFNYKADLTKAELIGLLAKTPPIKEKLDTFFYK
jgi:hypothetical protein